MTATDTISGLSNNDVVFTIDVQIMNATSITNATTPPDTIYLIGSGMTPLNLPTYTWFPVESPTIFSYALVGAPTFVTIGGAPEEIQVQTVNYADTGSYLITIETTETKSGLTDT